MSSYAYYSLPEERWSEIVPLVINAFGSDAAARIPSPICSRAIVAENIETGVIDGVVFLQFLPHLDTLCIAPHHAGVSAGKMLDTAKSELAAGSAIYSIVPDSDDAREAVTKHGMMEMQNHSVFWVEVA